MSESMFIKVKATSQGVNEKLKQVGNSFSKLGRETKGTTGEFSKFYAQTKKVNQSLANITKDANRSASGIKNLGGSFKGLNQIIGVTKLYMLAQALGKAVQASIDAIETANLYKVALGDMTEEADKTVNAMSELYGLDQTNLRSSVGTYALLARSMGMSSTQAEILSTNTSKLALDLSSLTNVPINQVMADLKSGLIGQSETVYKYGIDVTEAGIKAEALALGINKSVRNMSQGEKMALRYSAMLRQTTLAQGDFARTIETPANQLKVLSERMITLSRSIGSIFIPMLQVVLPYINGFVSALITLADAIASFFGYEAPDVNDVGNGIGTIKDDADDASTAIDGTTKAVKKLNRAVMSFDEFNIINKEKNDATGGAGSGVGGASILPDIDLRGYDNFMSKIKQRSDKIAKSIRNTFKKLGDSFKPVLDALKKLKSEGLDKLGEFTFDALLDFYDLFLVPLGRWVVGIGLPKLINILNDALNKVDWDTLNEAFERFWIAIEPFAEAVGEGIVDFFKDMADIGVTLLNVVIPSALNGTANAIGKFSPQTIAGVTTALLEFAVALKAIKIGKSVLTDLGNLKTKLGSLGKLGQITLAITGLVIAVKFAHDIWSTIFDEYSYKEIYDGLYAMFSDAFGNNVVGNAFADANATILTGLGAFFSGQYTPQEWIDGFMAWGKDCAKAFDKGYHSFDIDISGGLTQDLDTITLPFRKWWENSKADYEVLKRNLGIVFTGIKKDLSGAFGDAFNDIKGFFSQLPKWFSDRFNQVVKGAKQLKDDFIDIFSRIGVVVGNALESALKTIINEVFRMIESRINGFIDSLNLAIKIINKIPAVKIDYLNRVELPRLATGGIVDSPTTALIGEAGKEAVIPLENNTGWMDTLAERIMQYSGGNTQTISTWDMKQAFKDAIKESDFGDTVMQIDSKTVARASNKGNKELKLKFQ